MLNRASDKQHARDKSFTEPGWPCVDDAAPPRLPLTRKINTYAHSRPSPVSALSPRTFMKLEGSRWKSEFFATRWLCQIAGYLKKQLTPEIHNYRHAANRVTGIFGTGPRQSFRYSWSYRVTKRMVDVVLAFALIPFLVPVWMLLMVLIKCNSRGPVFYRHLRLGQDGRAFHLFKFRTMFLHGDALLEDYFATTPEARREWDKHCKLRWDPRVTSLGAILRRTSLDELPQIVNVLLGHMSFVGPRPIGHDEVRRYGAAFPYYCAAKPGITGLWQVSGRGTLSYEARVSLDIHYVTTWSLLQDLGILIRTGRAVRDSEGAY